MYVYVCIMTTVLSNFTVSSNLVGQDNAQRLVEDILASKQVNQEVANKIVEQLKFEGLPQISKEDITKAIESNGVNVQLNEVNNMCEKGWLLCIHVY